jgi:tight adherence protein C
VEEVDLATEETRTRRALRRVGEIVSAGRYSRRLQQELTRAGYYGSSAPFLYLGAKMTLLLVGLSTGVALAVALDLPTAIEVAIAAFVTALPFFLPNLVVMMRRERRSSEVRRRLPDAVDLLEICVSAGMGLDMAWGSVSEEIRRVSTILADEMELTNLEISLGVPRTTAMRHMAERTGADEISSIVSILVQTERFGASIIDALATFAKSMRETASTRAEENAEKMAVKMLFPMVLFIFPALLIVMVGPAVMNIVSVMT